MAPELELLALLAQVVQPEQEVQQEQAPQRQPERALKERPLGLR